MVTSRQGSAAMEKGLWVAMVVVGAILIYYGYSESQSFGSKLGATP
jgi:hypothetical protein